MGDLNWRDITIRQGEKEVLLRDIADVTALEYVRLNIQRRLEGIQTNRDPVWLSEGEASDQVRLLIEKITHINARIDELQLSSQ